MKQIVMLFFTLMLFTGCSSQNSEELTRIDVQKVNKQGDYEDASIITDAKTLNLLRSSFEEVEWQPYIKPKMSRNADVLATLFYTFDKNMPEKLFEYRIWFNDNDTATIISNNEKEGYGTIDDENAKILKSNLFN
ncbi:MAG TPA: hypothetical protein GXX18_05625 [Bacillales bacterium]|nr:hypothetical protein [Bacillales bacterium]